MLKRKRYPYEGIFYKSKMSGILDKSAVPGWVHLSNQLSYRDNHILK